MRHSLLILSAIPFLLSSAFLIASDRLPLCDPADVGLNRTKLSVIDEEVEKEIAKDTLPGCVVCIGRHGKIALLRAYGHWNRAVETTQAVPMRTDTLFELASVTKPVATATAIMLLAERGKLGIDDSVSLYLEEFDTPEKKEVTIRHLLVHVAGFPQGPGGPFDDADLFLKRLLDMKPQTKPGEKYLYSCASYIMLGEIVRRVAGKNLDEFTREQIFEPLGMKETGFVPDATLSRRAAPTEKRMQGQSHDFQAFALGGIAGNAGLFSTAEDLALFMDMMLKTGKPEGKPRILQTKTVHMMTAPNPAPPKGYRALGWTMQTGDSHRPKNMSAFAYGHGGYTGNAVWIDPQLDLFVIFLSNQPHRVVYPLASRVGDAAVAAVTVLPDEE